MLSALRRGGGEDPAINQMLEDSPRRPFRQFRMLAEIGCAKDRPFEDPVQYQGRILGPRHFGQLVLDGVGKLQNGQGFARVFLGLFLDGGQ